MTLQIGFFTQGEGSAGWCADSRLSAIFQKEIVFCYFNSALILKPINGEILIFVHLSFLVKFSVLSNCLFIKATVISYVSSFCEPDAVTSALHADTVFCTPGLFPKSLCLDLPVTTRLRAVFFLHLVFSNKT